MEAYKNVGDPTAQKSPALAPLCSLDPTGPGSPPSPGHVPQAWDLQLPTHGLSSWVTHCCSGLLGSQGSEEQLDVLLRWVANEMRLSLIPHLSGEDQ